MIPSISMARASATEPGAQPAVASGGDVKGFARASSLDLARRHFEAGMAQAAAAGEALPDAPPSAAAAAVAQQPQQASREDSRQVDETGQGLTPEQWLLAMIDQQLAAVEARDGVRLEGAAPEAADTTAQAPLEPLFAGLPAPDQAPVASQWGVTPDEALPGAATADRVPVSPSGWPGPVAGRVIEPALVGVASLSGDEAAQALLEPALEQMRAAADAIEAVEPQAGAERGQAPQALATDRGLKLQGPEAKWGEQMLMALRENVELQIQQKIQSATIRLDPPELGSLEILLSHESGRLNVQLSAANADVARLLQQTSDRLRQELVGQHFVQVNVQVGTESGGQQGQQRQRAALPADEAPLAARAEAQADNPGGEQRARDVLITV
ncbi:flagellar hook-length control protein FliK [Stutzerimonas stutzeri]